MATLTIAGRIKFLHLDCYASLVGCIVLESPCRQCSATVKHWSKCALPTALLAVLLFYSLVLYNIQLWYRSVDLMSLILVVCAVVDENSVEIKTAADSNDITECTRDANMRPYLCTLCHKRFITKCQLYVHTKCHTGETGYSCTQCEKRFSSQKGCRHHMNIHTTKYKCTQCGRCCESRSALAIHRRTHSGEKPFECTVCSKRFATSGSLVVHSRIHSGEKPYKCHVTKHF